MDQATDDGDKKIILCKRIRKQDLNEDERLDLRIFYWAAYNGFKKILRFMF